jgi:hypothetical protein
MEEPLNLVTPVLTGLFTIFISVSLIIQNNKGQSQEVQPLIVAKPVVNGKVTVLDLELHFATSILVRSRSVRWSWVIPNCSRR